MNTKKILTLLIAAFTIFTLASCSNDESNIPETSDTTETTPAHVKVWDADISTHWQTCKDCDETTAAEEHTLQDDSICSVCKAEIMHYADGSCDVSVYNDNGDLIHSINYYINGNISEEFRYEIEYDGNGNKVSEIVYSNSALSSESLYASNADGGIYTVQTKIYETDGSSSLLEYDDCGDLSHAVFYDADGNKSGEEFYEYADDANNNRYTAKYTVYDYTDSKIYIGEYNTYSDLISRTITDLDGNVERTERCELGYDEEGNPIWRKEYRNDVLMEEIVNYKTATAEDYIMNFPETVVTYSEDGSKVMVHYDDNINIDTETTYNADGTIKQVITYKYDLAKYDGYEEYYVSTLTQHDGDGNLVFESHMDAEGNVTEQYWYDENGNIIEE